jgi:glutathione S-transferase
MLTIYGGPTFNTTKIILTAEELGLKYEYIHIDLRKGEQKTAEHLQRHPLGKIPAIEYNGQPLFESDSICRFLTTVESSSMYSGDAYQRAIIDQWIDLMALHAGRWLGAAYFQEYISPLFFKAKPKQEVLDEANGFLDEQLPIIDARLAENKFLAGNKMTIADTIAFSYFYTHEFSSIDFSNYKNITNWYKAIRQRPAFLKTKDCLDKTHNL